MPEELIETAQTAASENVPSTPLGLSPHLIVEGGRAAIDFYKLAFNAVAIHVDPAPDSEKIMHATLLIEGFPVQVSDDFPEFMGGVRRSPQALGGTPITLHLQVPDADALWARAVEAGATPTLPLKVQFWGMKYGKLRDPFGHEWSIGQDVAQPSSAELEAAAREVFGKAGQ